MNTARELSDRLASLYRNERNAMADFLIALAAFDERKAWREIGYPSLWAFLRHELKLSKSAAFHRKTAADEAAKDALAHVMPEGNLADVLEHALDLVLAQARKKRGVVEKPRSGAKPPRDGSRHVPAKVARAVWTRSGERCECTLPNGERCEATRALEIDHIRPFALGGEATEENLRIACRDCNQLAARQAFGDAVIDRYAGRKGRAGSVAGAANTDPRHASSSPLSWCGTGAAP